VSKVGLESPVALAIPEQMVIPGQPGHLVAQAGVDLVVHRAVRVFPESLEKPDPRVIRVLRGWLGVKATPV